MKLRLISLFCFTNLLFACAMAPTDDIKITIQNDPKANIAGYKSYAWVGTAQLLNDPHGMWEPPKIDLDSEVQFLIDRELRGKGFTQTSSQPDLLIGYVAGVDMSVLEIKENPKSKLTMLKNVPKGALVVLLIDSSTLFPVWAGEAVANVNEKRPSEEMKRRLDYAISQMFKDLPAK